jgi:hypothetical protein
MLKSERNRGGLRMPQPITEDEFRLIKSRLEEKSKEGGKQSERAAWAIGHMVGRSAAKVSIIQACEDFEMYKAISKAEHPPVKNSLADRVTELERVQGKTLERVDALEERNGLTQTSLLEEV